MEKKITILDNEKGSAIILAVLILAVLTILGVSSVNTSTIELKIVRNEKLYQQNFYLAEAAAYEAGERLKIEDDPEELRPAVTTKDWLNEDDIDLTATDNWVDDDSADDTADQSAVSPDAKFASTGKGIDKGSSLDIGASSVHTYSLYGLSTKDNGKVMIEIGYKKRF